jgi:hypothetical protein
MQIVIYVICMVYLGSCWTLQSRAILIYYQHVSKTHTVIFAAYVF